MPWQEIGGIQSWMQIVLTGKWRLGLEIKGRRQFITKYGLRVRSDVI